MSRLEEFARGYHLGLENISVISNLPKEMLTYEEAQRQWARQEQQLSDMTSVSRFGGLVSLLLHPVAALRMHRNTNIMLKDETPEQYAIRHERYRRSFDG